MSIKQFPSKIKTEDLLKDLETSQEILNPIKLPDNAINFIMELNLKPGEYPVQIRLLYNFYKMWTPKPVSFYKFNLVINSYFEVSIVKQQKIIHINRDAFQLTKEAELILKRDFVYSPTEPKFKEHFERYLRYYDIKKGNIWIDFNLLNWIYNNYVKNCQARTKINEKSLKDFFKLYFESTVATKDGISSIFFKLDESIEKHFTLEIRRAVIRHVKKQQKKNQKK